jgi:hypothetical protein
LRKILFLLITTQRRTGDAIKWWLAVCEADRCDDMYRINESALHIYVRTRALPLLLVVTVFTYYRSPCKTHTRPVWFFLYGPFFANCGCISIHEFKFVFSELSCFPSNIYRYYHHQKNHWQNSDVWEIAFLRNFCQICLELDHPVFTSLDLATAMFLQTKVVSLASNLQPGGPGLCIYVPSDRVDQFYPQAPGSPLDAFYDSQGCGEGIQPLLLMGYPHVSSFDTYCNTLVTWNTFTLTKRILTQVIKFPHFMPSEGSVPCVEGPLSHLNAAPYSFASEQEETN